MITDERVRNTKTEGIDETVQYRIDPNNVAHISGILRNMYSDPAMAVVREYCANALDAHQMVGKATEPIHVWPPSMLDPWFRVRDYGPGLSREDTERLLFGYGASGEHKRTSNDQIGGFGIGAKCGFSLSDQFQYVVFHGGLKRTWTCFLDEHDVGRAAMLEEVPTDEPTGILVAIPVPQQQHSTVRERMQQAFQFFPAIPVIHEEDFPAIKPAAPVATGTLTVTEPGHQPVQVTWNVLPRQAACGGQMLIMFGNAAYECNFSQLPALNSEEWGKAHPLMQHGSRVWGVLSLRCPIGWLTLAPNRESLQYSKVTIRRLTALVQTMMTAEFGECISSRIVEAFGLNTGACRERLTLAKQLGFDEMLRQADSPGLAYGPYGWEYDCAKFAPSCTVGLQNGEEIAFRWLYTGRRSSWKNGHYWRLDTINNTKGRLPASAAYSAAGSPQSNVCALVMPKDRRKDVEPNDITLHRRALEAFLKEYPRSYNRGEVPRVVLQYVFTDQPERLWNVPAITDGSVLVLREEQLAGTVQDTNQFSERTPRAKSVRNGNSVRYAASGKLFVSWLGGSKSIDDPDRASAWWAHMPVAEIRQKIQKAPEDITYVLHNRFVPLEYTGKGGSASGFHNSIGPLLAVATRNGWLRGPLLGVREDDKAKLPPEAKELRVRIREILDRHFTNGDVSPEAADFWISLGEHPLFWKQILHMPRLRKRLAPLWAACRHSAKKAPGVCRWLQEINRDDAQIYGRTDLRGSKDVSPVHDETGLQYDRSDLFLSAVVGLARLSPTYNDDFGAVRTNRVQRLQDVSVDWLPAIPAMVKLRTPELTALMNKMIAKEPQLFATVTGAISVSVLLAEPLWAPKSLVKWWNKHYDATQHEKYADRVCIPYMSLPLLERRNFLDNRRSS